MQRTRGLHLRQRKALRALLREVRLAADLTQVALAKRLGKPQSYVSKSETGSFSAVRLQLSISVKLISESVMTGSSTVRRSF